LKIANAKAVEPLINALDDSNDEVRSIAAYALGNIGNEKAVEPLINALDDSNYQVKDGAIYALGKIGNAETVTKLMQKTDLDIYRSDIFLLVRKLAIRHSRELTHPLTRGSYSRNHWRSKLIFLARMLMQLGNRKIF
jgi:HEAT repeat protein